MNGLRHAIVNGVPVLNGTDLPSVGSDMPPKELHARLRLVSTFSIISNEPLGVRNRMSIAEMEQSNDSRLPRRSPRSIDPVDAHVGLARLADAF